MKKNYLGLKRAALLLTTLSFRLLTFAQTSPSAQPLPYSQNFAALVSTSTNFPVGLQGWTLVASDSLVFSTSGPLANSGLLGSSTAASTIGGVQNYNGKIGILPTTTVNPALCLALSTTGLSNVQVNFDAMTIRNPFNGTTQTRISGMDLQYQVGTIAGTWISVSGLTDGVYQNNTTTQITAVITPQNSQPKSLTLPAACNNQSVVYIRWVERIISGAGSDRPGFAVDNIVICPITTPALSISGPSAICSGQSASYFATPTNGGTTPTYQWKKNGTNAGTGSSITLSGLLVGDSVFCVLTSNALCITTGFATSNSIKLVSVASPPSSITPAITNASCASARDGAINITVNGGTGPFTACWDTINILNGPVFGVTVGSKTPSGPLFGRGFSLAFFIDGIESKELFLTKGISYSFNVMNTTGHPFHISTDSVGGNSLNIVTSGQTGAPTQNSTVTFIPNNSHASQLYYPCAVHQLMGYRLHPQNGLCVEDPTNLRPGIYPVIVTDANGCTISSQFTVAASSAAASVAIAASPAGAICSGTNVAFTATPTNGGTSPSYQWKKNGTNVGTNNPVYANNALNNNDSIRCIMTSSSVCSPGSLVSSSTIAMTVNTSATASVFIVAVPSGAICSGTQVNFSANPTNGGATPSFQWKKNGTNVGINSPVYSDNALNNGDSIRCVMTNNSPCVSGSPATSAPLVMTVSTCTQVTLKLRVFIEALYLGNDSLVPVLYNGGFSGDSTACDSIAVELRKASDPDVIISSALELLHSDGYAHIAFPSSVFGASYYIVVRFRNGLETWSKNPQLFNSSLVDVDFTIP